MTTKKERNDIDQKLIDAAYSATSGAAIGATLGLVASIATGSLIGTVIPFVGTIFGGLAGLAIGTGVVGINQKQKNISDENKTEH